MKRFFLSVFATRPEFKDGSASTDGGEGAALPAKPVLSRNLLQGNQKYRMKIDEIG